MPLAWLLLHLRQLSPFSSSFGVKVFSAAPVAAVSFFTLAHVADGDGVN